MNVTMRKLLCNVVSRNLLQKSGEADLLNYLPFKLFVRE